MVRARAYPIAQELERRSDLTAWALEQPFVHRSTGYLREQPVLTSSPLSGRSRFDTTEPIGDDALHCTSIVETQSSTRSNATHYRRSRLIIISSRGTTGPSMQNCYFDHLMLQNSRLVYYTMGMTMGMYHNHQKPSSSHYQSTSSVSHSPLI